MSLGDVCVLSGLRRVSRAVLGGTGAQAELLVKEGQGSILETFSGVFGQRVVNTSAKGLFHC